MSRLRAAKTTDLAEVAAIWRTGWHDAHDGRVPDALAFARTSASFAARAVDRISDTTVAVASAGIVGFVMVHDDEVDQLYVAAGHRGSGVAGLLLAAAERQIAERGFGTAWLAVVPANHRARRFYERQGWRDNGWFSHRAPGHGGPIEVPCRRYVKDVA